jgi:hypothetical protein
VQPLLGRNRVLQLGVEFSQSFVKVGRDLLTVVLLGEKTGIGKSLEQVGNLLLELLVLLVQVANHDVLLPLELLATAVQVARREGFALAQLVLTEPQVL